MNAQGQFVFADYHFHLISCVFVFNKRLSYISIYDSILYGQYYYRIVFSLFY